MWFYFCIIAASAVTTPAVALPSNLRDYTLARSMNSGMPSWLSNLESIAAGFRDLHLQVAPETAKENDSEDSFWTNRTAAAELKKQQVAELEDQERSITTTSMPDKSAVELRDAQYGNGSVILGAGEFLTPNVSYYSPSRAYRLILQTDQNLVLYRECDGRAVWASETVGLPPLRAVLGSDGHFTVGSWGNGGSIETSYWSTETWGYGESRLLLSDQGYFYLCNDKGCYWRSSRSSGTQGWQCGGRVNLAPAETYNYLVVVRMVDYMDLDMLFYSSNGKFTLGPSRFNRQQLMVVRRQDNRIGFKAATQERINSVRLQEDGNLVAYSIGNRALWSSITNAPNYDNPELRLYDDGFLYLCDSRGCYWQSSGFLDQP
ncbi:uncharacterized protein LOC129601913 [Paramacrobiotus metropolitanus]|uniref:uncharacterized protein LOC129601913 n=1 Tax=Paramacrobiotus metropolitanus TaxID=2943436 RepID=UPI002445A937|nr:uncharacterized protein LOC129601913 [Paramacrobiotus metropolitanus]